MGLRVLLYDTGAVRDTLSEPEFIWQLVRRVQRINAEVSGCGIAKSNYHRVIVINMDLSDFRLDFVSPINDHLFSKHLLMNAHRVLRIYERNEDSPILGLEER